MTDSEKQDWNNLTTLVHQITQQIAEVKKMQNEHAKQHQQTRSALDKLAALDDLEFVEALNEWVSKKKWAELKKDPR